MRLCIVTPNRRAYCETFIHAQIERLPTETIVLHGGGEGFQFYHDETPLFAEDTGLATVLRAGYRKLRDLPWYHFHEQSLKRFLLQQGVDVVLAQYGNTGVLVRETCWAGGIPLIVHFHGYDAYRRDILFDLRDDYHDLFDKAFAIIAVSHDMVDQLAALGAPQEKVHYAPYGVDPTIFEGACPQHNPPHFLAVGRFVNKKAPFLTLLAFNEMRCLHKESRLLFVGDGPLLEVVADMVQALGLSDCVELLGACPHDEVVRLMRGVRAFVQHSVTAGNGDAEGTPVAVMEASAIGLPVVATRHKGIADVVVDGETGYLVAERDIASMSRRMLELAQDPALAGRLGAAGRARTTKLFNLDDSIGKLWALIQASQASI